MSGNSPSQRGVWLAIIALAGLCVATAAGVVFLVAGAQPIAAIGAGGTAFVGFTSLGLAAYRFVSG